MKQTSFHHVVSVDWISLFYVCFITLDKFCRIAFLWIKDPYQDKPILQCEHESRVNIFQPSCFVCMFKQIKFLNIQPFSQQNKN